MSFKTFSVSSSLQDERSRRVWEVGGDWDLLKSILQEVQHFKLLQLLVKSLDLFTDLAHTRQ